MEAVQHALLICKFPHHGYFYSWKNYHGNLVYYGVGPLLIHGRACKAAQINTQEATSACLCHSVATKNRDTESTSLYTNCAGK